MSNWFLLLKVFRQQEKFRYLWNAFILLAMIELSFTNCIRWLTQVVERKTKMLDIKARKYWSLRSFIHSLRVLGPLFDFLLKSLNASLNDYKFFQFTYTAWLLHWPSRPPDCCTNHCFKALQTILFDCVDPLCARLYSATSKPLLLV